jgi:hypothetical protein
MEPDPPAAPASILDIPMAAVITILIMTVANPRPPAAAATVIDTPLTEAPRLTSMHMTNDRIHSRVIILVSLSSATTLNVA